MILKSFEIHNPILSKKIQAEENKLPFTIFYHLLSVEIFDEIYEIKHQHGFMIQQLSSVALYRVHQGTVATSHAKMQNT